LTAKKRLVVVGNGMAGARLVEDVLARGGAGLFDITVFGDEPHGNYNRILLSGVLAGSHCAPDIMINSREWYAAHGVRLYAGVRADRIDVHSRHVYAGGLVEPYDLLVLATGSRAAVPPIRGVARPGVFPFRTLDDCTKILACARTASIAAVIGGGLLGLEAARGLLNYRLAVHVVHLADHVMDAQLDDEAGRILQRQLERLGVRVHTGKITTAIEGNGRVTGLAFRDGSSLACDMVILAAGVRPNVELAARAGLPVGRGIIVQDDLACPGAEAVFAIGECAEHRGQLYGLVAPVWEQASVLADRLTGRNAAARYEGTRLSTKLKIAGVDVAVMGLKDAVEEDDEVVSYTEPSRGIYKKLVVRNNRLAGAIVIGDGVVVPSLAQAFLDGSLLAENRPELLFRIASDQAAAPPPAEKIPDTALICDCNVVTKARIVEAVLSGARSLQAVCDATRAGTGCGSCRPEVQRIVELASNGVAEPSLLAAPPEPAAAPAEAARDVVVTLNKVERLKKEKDGLDILPDVPRLAAGGWEAIAEGDRERLKWAGVFFRRQTPGRFMMRLRMPNGLTRAEQLSTIAGISEELGTGSVDITTRQQVQVRGFAIEHLPEIWDRLDRVGLVSLQTGMDNVRNVIGCPLAGLTPQELFDASPVVHEFTQMFLRNKAFTNLPRKFNVGITGCTEHCTPAESQDLALTPALKQVSGREIAGFNVAVGGKMGSGGCRVASPLDVFVEPGHAAALCAEIVLLFRDHGPRAARNRARLAFLVDSWGTPRFRSELQKRVGGPLHTAGRDVASARTADHLGVTRQKQAGFNCVGLAVPVGRVSAQQLSAIADVAKLHGSGEVRLTTSQNVVIPYVPDDQLPAVLSEPIASELPHDPPGALRGLVACTGIDYCHFALIETKELAVRTARHLAAALPHGRRFTTHWSGCPAGCGNHATADVGLLGKNIRVGGQLVEAVDVFVGGRAGADAKPGIKLLEDVPCDQLPFVLERVIPYVGGKRVVATNSTPTNAPRVYAGASAGPAHAAARPDGSP
jgi:NAD(P)H-dependent nitrite reductase large subunit